MTTRPGPDLQVVTPALLRERPLPSVSGTTDKGTRGRVLVVGGGDETPGAVLLAGVAALRAGAGKLQLATSAAVATGLALAVPEARVVALPAGRAGSLGAEAAEAAGDLVRRADAVLVGTGALDPDASGALLRGIVPALGPETALVVDAGALPVLADDPGLLAPVRGRTVLIPNEVEAGVVLGDDAGAGPEAVLGALVARVGCTVALRHPDTLLAGPGTSTYLDRSGHPGLGTSGSGDVLAGVLTGLLARGAEPLDAALWAVHLHGRAGEQVAARVGGLGLLARELVDELPRVMSAVAGVAA